MKKMLFVLFVLILSSCDRGKIIKYKYNNITLTRIDTSGETRIYYGDFKNNNYPESFFKISYSGLNSGFSGFLIFNQDSSVTALPILGYFELSTTESKRFSIRDDSKKTWYDAIDVRYNNVVKITDVNSERKTNKENLSNVSAIYPTY